MTEETNEKYPGCPPGWTPDELLTTRGFASQSIEEQVKAARAQWRLDPLNPANELPVDRKLPVEGAPEIEDEHPAAVESDEA